MWHSSASGVTDWGVSHRAAVHHQPPLSVDAARLATQMNLHSLRVTNGKKKGKKQMSGTAAALRSTKCGRRALDGWGAWHGCGRAKRTARKWCFNTSQAVILWGSSRPTFTPPAVSFSFRPWQVTHAALFFSLLSSIFLVPSLCPFCLVISMTGGGAEGRLSAQTIWWGFLEGGFCFSLTTNLLLQRPCPFFCFFHDHTRPQEFTAHVRHLCPTGKATVPTG